MKKLLAMVFLVILFVNCISTGNINNDIFGERYDEKNAKFSMYIPKDWVITDSNQKYMMVMGPIKENFRPNITFSDEQYSGIISEYIDAVIGILPQVFADFEVIERERFITNTNLQGGYIIYFGRLNEIMVRQKMYIIQNKGRTTVMAITCTASPVDGEEYDSVFDASVKTFDWKK